MVGAEKCTCPNGVEYEVGDNNDGCKSLACDGKGAVSGTCGPFGIDSANAGRKVTCGGATVTMNAAGLALSRTTPIVLGSNFSGAVGADVSLKRVSEILFDRWIDIKRDLRKYSKYEVNADTSSIFIVNQVSKRFPEQEGVLVGTSEKGWPAQTVENAINSSLPIVAETTLALLLKSGGSWRSDDLLATNNTVFYYSVKGIRAQPPRLDYCNPLETRTDMADCMQVAFHSMALDSDLRWLVVIALPMEAYFKNYNDQVVQTSSGIDRAQGNAYTTLTTTNAACIVVIVIATVIALLIACMTSVLVLRPLSRLGKQMERLSRLDFARDSPELKELKEGVRERVTEIRDLRTYFSNLSESMETFAKFVPEAVVRELVSVSENKRQRYDKPNVWKRQVTIMFSDVKDFTSIAEKLTQKDLLFVLTLYLTVMTRIIDAFEGVVGEVLGDGLLCFWNTPEKVQDHAVKACRAALAQQQALGSLNDELTKRGLPKLQMRIGIHTGEVWTGNIGSDRYFSQNHEVKQKMKFGCMGDAVTLAGKLEEMCKVYGVGTMCSGATRDRLPDAFVSRLLDLHQVKGKQDATEIYQLIGMNCDLPEWSIKAVPSSSIAQAKLYEEALDAYQKAKFDDAIRLAEALVKEYPDDTAAIKLLERAKVYESKPTSTGGFWSFLSKSTGPPMSGEDLAAWTGVQRMMDK